MMRGHKRVIIQAETGAGKTVMAGEIIKSAIEKGKTVLVVVYGRDLVWQWSGSLRRQGIEHGVMIRGRGMRYDLPVTVASKSTLISWCAKRGIEEWPSADLLIVDECHEATTKEWKQILDHYGGR